MSEGRGQYSEGAYVLEDAIFHGLAFAVVGAPVALLVLGLLSEFSSIHRIGFDEVGRHIFSYLRLGMFSFVLTVFLIGPPMFITGILVSVMSYGLENERRLTLFGGIAFAAIAFFLGWIMGEPKNARFPSLWVSAGQLLAGGLAGAAMVRSTRFLRKWRDRAASLRAGEQK